ncbi:hypothetical protein [Polaromonas sp.]|uniref:hypothetical protein n=1 Tax=Polaromonas sp. TaxID=1869339 RepID=UPI002D792F97|nr:hypothetical protein [Polaromonas sp.]
METLAALMRGQIWKLLCERHEDFVWRIEFSDAIKDGCFDCRVDAESFCYYLNSKLFPPLKGNGRKLSRVRSFVADAGLAVGRMSVLLCAHQMRVASGWIPDRVRG